MNTTIIMMIEFAEKIANADEVSEEIAERVLELDLEHLRTTHVRPVRIAGGVAHGPDELGFLGGPGGIPHI